VIEGLVALVLVLAGLRTAIMEAVPHSLKLAIGVGIGLFITPSGMWAIAPILVAFFAADWLEANVFQGSLTAASRG
jgi:xanthine/uracil/vitamin C permease (AzgA family)